MKSSLPNYRQSPRKVRLVADLIKGKSVAEALVALDILPKRASVPLKKLVLSAVANAKENFKTDAGGLIVKEFRVDKGVVLKRSMPRAMGRAFGIKKRTSHIHLVLGEGRLKVENGESKTPTKKRRTKK